MSRQVKSRSFINHVIVPPGAFCAVEGLNSAPMRWEKAYDPPKFAKWRVELWAKCGRFERYHTIKCEDEMSSDELINHYFKEIAVEFLADTREAFEQELVILRLAGKHSIAYELEGKPYRYGYAAYEE